MTRLRWRDCRWRLAGLDPLPGSPLEMGLLERVWRTHDSEGVWAVARSGWMEVLPLPLRNWGLYLQTTTASVLVEGELMS